MKIGSHNTFSYLPVKHWYMWPVVWTARCQRVDFGEQWLAGARLFDLRVRFDKNGDPIICHGLIEFEAEKTFLDNIFKYLDYGWFRVVLETTKHDFVQESHFKTFCRHLQETYPKLTFFGGNNRADWNCKSPIYDFRVPLEDLDDKYSSTTSLFPERFEALRVVDDLLPIFYAWRYNRKNREAGTKHEWLFLDFVDIK